MPLTPGLSPSIRQPAPEIGDDEPVTVEIIEGGPDKPKKNDDGKILEIEHDDGSITISLDGKSLLDDEERRPTDWFDNLVEDIDDMELDRISGDLMRGIEDDIQSRKDWIEDRTNGLKLMGLKVEVPGLGSSSDGAPV